MWNEKADPPLGSYPGCSASGSPPCIVNLSFPRLPCGDTSVTERRWWSRFGVCSWCFSGRCKSCQSSWFSTRWAALVGLLIRPGNTLGKVSLAEKIEGKDFVLIIHAPQKGTGLDFASGDWDWFVCMMMSWVQCVKALPRLCTFCNCVLFSLPFTVDAFSFAPEANLRSPRDVEDLQGGEGCEKSRPKQCNPCCSEVGTSGAWAPAGPRPGTGTVKSQKTPFVIPSVHSR